MPAARGRSKQRLLDLEHDQASDSGIGFDQGTLVQPLDHYYRPVTPQWDHALWGVDLRRQTYEDHFEVDPRKGYREVVRFHGMGTSLPATGSGYARQNAWPRCQLIENVDEVERLLRDTPYAALLQD